MSQIGIMQGRLAPPVEGRFQCFPRDHWRDEFPRAADAGLSCIEWIYDLYGADVNPLGHDAGVAEMKTLAMQHGVTVRSLVADYFMDKPFLRATPSEVAELASHLEWLLPRCALAGIERIVLPFVDASRIETPLEQDHVIAILERVLPVAQRAGVELHLETSLAPQPFAKLLTALPHPMLKANYDSGNSASLGYRPADEFAAYGQQIGSIHIKDRVRGGGTVPLGTGSADFDCLFECIRKVGYAGDYILQVAREVPGNEVIWAAQNRQFVERRLKLLDQ